MKKNKQENPWWQPGMLLFGRLSGWIAGPIITALFIGKWLDRKYDSEPWIFLASVGIAFIISSVGIVREAKVVMNKIIEDEKKKNLDKAGKENKK
jgi:F0F1-type ATP synthase assembly protein I